MAVMRGIRPYGLRLPKLFPGASVRRLLQGLLRERTCAAGCRSPGQKTVRRAVGRSPGRRDSVHEGGERDSVQKPPPTDRPGNLRAARLGRRIVGRAGRRSLQRRPSRTPSARCPTPTATRSRNPLRAGLCRAAAVSCRVRIDATFEQPTPYPSEIHTDTAFGTNRIRFSVLETSRRNMPNGDRYDDPRTKRFRCRSHPGTS